MARPMSAGKLKILLEEAHLKIGQLEAAGTEAENKAQQNWNAYCEAAKETNELRHKIERIKQEHGQMSNELAAAKIEIANLQRLNAIQAGYIQRANEDEDFKASSYTGFSIKRNGPRLDDFDINVARYSRPMTIR